MRHSQSEERDWITISFLVKDVYSQSFTGVHEDDTLSHCLSLLEKDKRRVLVVLDNEKKQSVTQNWLGHIYNA
jgi:CBS-domain-containing membrane protein